jgi:hypothetical protein
MELNQRKQAFSVAYARAVASVAGFTVYSPEVDDDSVDLGIAAGSSHPRRPRLEAQMKCSADDVLGASSFPFFLIKKNYDDLRVVELVVPRILVVVRVPPDPNDWLDITEERALLRFSGYWHSLRGAQDTSNESGITVHIQRSRLFDAAQLKELMARIQSGGNP